MNGVINDQIDGDVGIDLGGIRTETLDGITHGRQIDDSGDSSEILEDDTSGLEGNLGILLAGLG